MFRDYAQRAPSGKTHTIELRFLRSPVEILGEGEDGPVTGIRVSINRLENGRAVPTGEEEVIECGLVLRSIGYRGTPMEGVPWDEKRGLIVNDGGRIAPGEYCVGWIKRGPSGVIGTNKKDAADTVAGSSRTRSRSRSRALEPTSEWLAERAPEVVTWEGWQAIDEAERSAGEPHGRPRVKLVRLADLLEAGRATAAR